MLESITSKSLYLAFAIVAAIVILLGSFTLGIHVGERKARHMAGWYAHYEQEFNRSSPMMNRRQPSIPNLQPGLPGGHGVFGKIISISGSTLLVQGKDGLEQSVVVTSSTSIRMGRAAGSLQNIQANMPVAVFGDPDDQGQIEARLIRLFEPGLLPS